MLTIMEDKKVTYEEALARFKHSLEIKHATQKRMAGYTLSLEDIVRQGDEEITEGNFEPAAIDDLWK